MLLQVLLKPNAATLSVVEGHVVNTIAIFSEKAKNAWATPEIMNSPTVCPTKLPSEKTTQLLDASHNGIQSALLILS